MLTQIEYRKMKAKLSDVFHSPDNPNIVIAKEGWLPRRHFMAYLTVLDRVFFFYLHHYPWPVKAAKYRFQCILDSQVTPNQVGVGQMHNGVNFSVGGQQIDHTSYLCGCNDSRGGHP